eukprot:scaffold13845_cov22-Tisochrysis_lutea.AAC.1
MEARQGNARHNTRTPRLLIGNLGGIIGLQVHNGAHSHSGFDAAGDAKALGIDHLDHGCFEVQAHADKGRKKRTVSTMAFYIRRGLA